MRQRPLKPLEGTCSSIEIKPLLAIGGSGVCDRYSEFNILVNWALLHQPHKYKTVVAQEQDHVPWNDGVLLGSHKHFGSCGYADGFFDSCCSAFGVGHPGSLSLRLTLQLSEPHWPRWGGRAGGRGDNARSAVEARAL